MSVKISYQSACVINHIILSELWHNRSVCNKSPIYTAHSTEHSNKVSFLEWWFLHYFLFQIVLENSSFLFSYPVKANFDWSPDLHNKVQGIHYMYVAEKNQWSVSSSVLNSFKKKEMNNIYFEDIFCIWKPPSLSLLRFRCYGRWFQVGFITQKVFFLQKISYPTAICAKLYVYNSTDRRRYFCLSICAWSFACKQQALLFE